MKCFIACLCCVHFRDNLLPVTAVGLTLHLLVTYGVTNKPFSLVSKGNQRRAAFVIQMVFVDFDFKKILNNTEISCYVNAEMTHLCCCPQKADLAISTG